MLSRVWLFSTTQTVDNWALLSKGFSRQEYWVAISSPQGIFQPRDRTCISLSGGWIFFFLTTWVTWEAHFIHTNVYASVSISQSIRPPLPNLGVHALVLSDCVSMSTLQTKTTYAKHGEVESNSEESIRGITFIVPAPLSPESLLLVV